MIASIYIHNIALIDELKIDFTKGLNVLSGETGAGKSIVVDSMNLLLGERADRDLLRHGQEKARVEAVLKIDVGLLKDFFEENALEEDEELILSRDITSAGKNVCRINGVVVTLAALKSLTDRIIDLHGQHVHQSLLQPKNHLTFLDNFYGEELAGSKQKISELYNELLGFKAQLKGIGGSQKEREDTIDLLSYQVNEIQNAELSPGELDELLEERDKIANAQSIADAFSYAYAMLYGSDESDGAIYLLQRAVNRIESVSEYDAAYRDLAERFSDAAYEMEDCARETGSLADSMDFDEDRIEEIEQRIQTIRTLMRKYNGDEAEVLAYCEDMQNRLKDLKNAEALGVELNKKIADIEAALYAESAALSNARRKAAEKLAKSIIKELAELGMGNARFEVRFADLPAQEDAVFSRKGLDDAEFYLTVNAGEPLKPLSKTASGGEISRVMLAFKSIFADTDDISTMIFDEIDTGISGRTAQVVAQKMAAIAKKRQVICVTHLPQIAAMADANYLIEKESDGDETNTRVQKLNEKERVDEISRLSGGMNTDHAKEFARELIENAHKVKAKL